MKDIIYFRCCYGRILFHLFKYSPKILFVDIRFITEGFISAFRYNMIRIRGKKDMTLAYNWNELFKGFRSGQILGLWSQRRMSWLTSSGRSSWGQCPVFGRGTRVTWSLHCTYSRPGVGPWRVNTQWDTKSQQMSSYYRQVYILSLLVLLSVILLPSLPQTKKCNV